MSKKVKEKERCTLCGIKCIRRYFIKLRVNSEPSPFCDDCFIKCDGLNDTKINRLIKKSNKGYIIE